MSSIAEATPIILTSEERAELESLARSTKTEYRARVKARIVLMAADGAATRAIAREVGSAIRIVSKWRMRYAKDRLAGFDESGNRGAVPKFGPATGRRILALLDTKPPKGYANWTGSLIAWTLCEGNMSGAFFAPRKTGLPGRQS